jgi:CheY-like chemotaxis protein
MRSAKIVSRIRHFSSDRSYTSIRADHPPRRQLVTAIADHTCKPTGQNVQTSDRTQQETVAHRVLVVDDNPDAADSLAMLLQALGNDVRVAYDGEEAIDKALDFSPEVVLLDIALPKVHGYDVAKRIRGAKGRDVVLVAVTGWGHEEDRRRSREAGFDYHLTKPVDPVDLARLVATAPLSTAH